jgi:hypothetical protein
MFAIALGGGFTMQYQGSIHYEFMKHFMLSMTIAIHTLPIIYLARIKRKQDNLFALRAIVILVLFGFLTRLGNIGFHFYRTHRCMTKFQQTSAYLYFYYIISLHIPAYCLPFQLT